jgi:hypothetical protein
MAKIKYRFIRILKKDRKYGKIRFKSTVCHDPGLKNLIDIVEFEELISLEKERLPLFTGTQFGVGQGFTRFTEASLPGRKLAVFAKSGLSGHIAGLGIYQLDENKELKKLIFFEND